MTILVVGLLGAGALLIASALDNTPIVSTFQKIISGQKIDWTGGNATPTAPAPPANHQKGTSPTNGQCPTGWTLANDGMCYDLGAVGV